jgi:hypothetical protein
MCDDDDDRGVAGPGPAGVVRDPPPVMFFSSSPLMTLPLRAMLRVCVFLDATSLWAVSATCRYARLPQRLARVCSGGEEAAAVAAVAAAATAREAAEAAAAAAVAAEPGAAVRTTARRFNKPEAVARVRAADEAHARAAVAAAAAARAAEVADAGAPLPMPVTEHACAILGNAICRKW